MKKIMALSLIVTLALSLGGCSWVKKVGSKIKGSDSPKSEKMMKAEDGAKKGDKMSSKKSSSTGSKKGVRCSTKKTYEKNSACWHWKRGARIGKPGYGDKAKPDSK